MRDNPPMDPHTGAELLSQFAEQMDTLRQETRDAARREQARVEYAIRGAIRSGYDGVDVNRPPPHEGVFGIASIVPWRGDPPDGANGYLTTRYEWPWFDDATLIEIARTGDIPPSMLSDGGRE